MPTASSLRERKKRHTREAIVDAALELFEARGFERTTIADVAGAANIAPRTFFGYFRSKEEVVFSDVDADFAELSARLEGRAVDETAIAALRAWIVERLAAGGLDDRLKACRRRLVAESEALAAHDEHVKGRFRDLLAGAVARDLGDEADDLRPRMVAAAAIAALEALGPGDGGARSTDESLAVLDQATTFLDGGLTALRDARP